MTRVKSFRSRFIPAGAKVEVRVTKRGYIGAYRAFRSPAAMSRAKTAASHPAPRRRDRHASEREEDHDEVHLATAPVTRDDGRDDRARHRARRHRLRRRHAAIRQVAAEQHRNGFYDGNPGAVFRCYLLADGALAGDVQTIALGVVNGAVRGGLFAPSATIDSATAKTITIRCDHFGTAPKSQFGPYFGPSVITAVRANSLDAADA